jgi:molecular chaperone GrpE
VSSPDREEPVVIRDKRRIDPVTGQAREVPAEADAPAGTAAGSGANDVPKAEALLLEERTRDLQRVQAEYANYRKRADRERLAAGDLGVGRVLGELLPILDDLDRAREHGDLTGGLKAIADKLDAVVAGFGLVAFGEVGDPFDPTIHEAVMHEDVSADAAGFTVPTATTVLRKGYRHGERLLRAAMVGVSDPVGPSASSVPPSAQSSAPSAELGDEPADTEADE